MDLILGIRIRTLSQKFTMTEAVEQMPARQTLPPANYRASRAGSLL